VITSRDNEKLKLVRKLHERSWRDKHVLYFVEAEDAVAAATAEPVELLVAGEPGYAGLLGAVGSAAHPPRVIAVYRRDDLPPPEPRPAALALWRMADPGNVGTLIRTADAFGAAVALSEGCADPTGPKALRASAGSIWRVPLLPFDAVPGRRVALVARGGEPLGQIELAGDTTFLVGAEREGLPDTVERDAEAWIPIGGAESLNAAVAGSIALYEWRRRNA
jgi:TrmH family RNA methyltransferase